MSRNHPLGCAADNALYPGYMQPCPPALQGRRSDPERPGLGAAVLQLVRGSMRSAVSQAAERR
jgi:hypothetical protein